MSFILVWIIHIKHFTDETANSLWNLSNNRFLFIFCGEKSDSKEKLLLSKQLVILIFFDVDWPLVLLNIRVVHIDKGDPLLKKLGQHKNHDDTRKRGAEIWIMSLLTFVG